jgi:hypothetical protein
MIDTNVVLVITGIVTLLLIGLIFVNSSKSSSTSTMAHSKTAGYLGRDGHGVRQLPKCVTLMSHDISGLKFFNFDTRTKKVTNQITSHHNKDHNKHLKQNNAILIGNNTVQLMGNSAVLITNSSGKDIQKINISVKANDSPTNNIWIYPADHSDRPLALNPGNNMPYYIDLSSGSSVILDVANIKKETVVTFTINSISITP